MGKCALKRAMAGCAFEAVVESATKTIGISELKKKQGRSMFICYRKWLFRFATDGLHGKFICFALLALFFDSVRGDTGSTVLCISPLTVNKIEQHSKFCIRGTICIHKSKTLQVPYAPLRKTRTAQLQRLK